MTSTEGRRGSRLPLVAAFIAVFGIAAGVITWLMQDMPRPPSAVAGPATPMADFVLTDQDGKPFDSRSLRGRAALVFFGFTHCPDVCPTTLAAMTHVLETLGPDADKVRPIFISVDPERDTPEALKLYGEMFDPRIVMLTGSPAQIAAVAKGWYVYYERQPTGAAGDYLVDHTASVFLVDREGLFRSTFDFHEDETVIVDKVKLLIER